MMTRKARALGMNSTVFLQSPPASPNDAAEHDDRRATLSSSGRAIQDRFPKYFAYFSEPIGSVSAAGPSAAITVSSGRSRAWTASRPATPACPASIC